MPQNEKVIDYGAILADLEAKKAVLENAIASLKTAIAAGALGTTEGMSYLKLAGTLVNPEIHGGEVPAGAFLGKSIPEAAKLYLSIVKKKQTTKEIADALREGGMETTGRGSFESIVSAALYRVRSAGDIVRVKGAWGLAEWWPAGVGSAQEQPKGRKSRKAKRKHPRQRELTSPSLSEKREPGSVEEEHHPAKLPERAVAFINSHPKEEFTAKQLSERFGVHNKVISLTLAKPVKEGLIRMSAPRTYTATRN
jgi:hypothetical protein